MEHKRLILAATPNPLPSLRTILHDYDFEMYLRYYVLMVTNNHPKSNHRGVTT